MTEADGWIWFIDQVNRHSHSSLDSRDHWEQGARRCWNCCLIKTVACSFQWVMKQYIFIPFNHSFSSKTQPEVFSALSSTRTCKLRVKPTCLLLGDWAFAHENHTWTLQIVSQPDQVETKVRAENNHQFCLLKKLKGSSQSRSPDGP